MPVPAPGAPYRFTVEEYVRMGELGVLNPAARTELVDGQIVLMTPVNAPHVVTKNAIRRRVEASLAGSPDWEVIDRDPVRIPDADAPQPDVAIVRLMTRAALASAADALLIVEVSDTTLADDLGRKRRLYGGAGVPNYWVADVNGRVLHRFAEPESGDYRVHDVLRVEMVVQVPGAEGETAAVPVSTLFP
jgi:Uma2 family endonuclease